MKSRIISVGKFLLFLGAGLVITWLSLRNLTPGLRTQLVDSIRNANYLWVGLVMLLGIVSHIVRALRWKMLLEPVGAHPSLRNIFIAVMTGYFANLAFPRFGEVVRCGVLHTTDKVPVNKSFGTVVTERGLDLLLFILLFFILIFTQYTLLVDYLDQRVFPGLEGKVNALGANHLLLMLAGCGVLVMVAFILIIRRAKPEQRIRYKLRTLFTGFWEGLISVGSIRKPWLFIFYTFLIWFIYFLMTWLCLGALEETRGLPPSAGFAVLVLGSIGVMITPGGIGLYPLIARDTLMLFGISKGAGFAMGWILWTSQTALIILLGLLAMLWLSTVRRKQKEASRKAD